MKKLLAIMMLLLIVTGCSNESEEEVPVKELYSLNDPAIQNDITFTITKAEARESDNMFIEAEEGNVFYVIEVKIENNSDDDFNSSSIMNYTLKDEDGREYDLSLFTDLNGSLDTTVAKGESGIGEIAYEVPAEGKLYFYIKSDFFGDDLKFAVR